MSRGRASVDAGPEPASARRAFLAEPVRRISLAGAAAASILLTLPLPRPPMTIQPDSLHLELHAPASVRPGEPIRFTLTIRNRSERSLDLYLRGHTPTLDVVVASVQGEVVWQRLEHEIIPAIVHLRVLKPGERLALTATWDQRTKSGGAVAAGRYTARALLLAEGEALEAPPQELEIAGR